MVWAKNGTPDTLSSSASSISISDLTAKKLLVLLFNHFPDGNVDDPDLTVDVGSTGDYAVRGSQNGSTDVASTSENEFRVDSGNNAYTRFHISYIVNIDGEEKLGIGFTMRTLSGASSVPDRKERFWKVDTSTDSSQIGSITITPTGNMATGSNLSVLTGDETGEAILGNNVQSGSRFEATDTRKIYYGALPSVTFENLFSTDNMTHTTTQTAIESGYFRVNHRVGSGADDHAYWDLGTTLSDNWVMRCKFSCTAKSSSTSNPNTAGLFSLSASNDNDFSVNGLGFKVSIGGGGNYDNLFFAGGTSNQSGGEGYNFSGVSDFDNINNAGTTKYIEIIKNGTSITMNVYDDEYVTLYDTVTTTHTGTMTGLRYFTYKNRDDIAGSHTETIHIDDLRIYNGVTNTTDFIWTEEA